MALARNVNEPIKEIDKSTDAVTNAKAHGEILSYMDDDDEMDPQNPYIFKPRKKPVGNQAKDNIEHSQNFDTGEKYLEKIDDDEKHHENLNNFKPSKNSPRKQANNILDDSALTDANLVDHNLKTPLLDAKNAKKDTVSDDSPWMSFPRGPTPVKTSCKNCNKYVVTEVEKDWELFLLHPSL